MVCSSDVHPANVMRLPLLPAAVVLAWLVVARPVVAQDAEDAPLCATGRVSSIEIRNGSVFDPATTDSRVVRWAFGTANLLHLRTRESFIRKELLFRVGDCADPFLLDEARRMLEAYSILRDVELVADDDGNGGVRVVVTTWDEWSTQVDLQLTYDEGVNLEKFQATEQNLFGRGMFLEYTHRHRRDVFERSLGFSTPRLFGRGNAGFTVGRRRAGGLFYQKFDYPFVGERGRYSFWENYERRTDFFSWVTGGTEDFSHVLVPAAVERAEISAALQFGEPGGTVIAGLAVTRDHFWYPGDAELAFDADFDDRTSYPVPAAVATQLEPWAATRLALHLGTRRYTQYRRYVGLDAVREAQTVPLGWFGGVTVGHSVPVLTPTGSPALEGAFGRVRVAASVPLGEGLVHGAITAEGRRDGGWKDVLAEADVALFARFAGLPSHTFFARASAAGGFNSHLPFQMTLGGREGVRSLLEDDHPGGRTVRFTLEDRLAPAWLRMDAADVGFTLMADVGRMWRGDVPYGRDSGWLGGVGAGLRLAVPSRSRNTTRLDVMMPVGAGGQGPVFRITVEMNQLRSGFQTPKLRRSFRVSRGPEVF